MSVVGVRRLRCGCYGAKRCRASVLRVLQVLVLPHCRAPVLRVLGLARCRAQVLNVL